MLLQEKATIVAARIQQYRSTVVVARPVVGLHLGGVYQLAYYSWTRCVASGSFEVTMNGPRGTVVPSNSIYTYCIE